MMDRERAVARNNHDAVEYGFIAERDRFGRYDRFSPWHLLADFRGDVILERADPVQGERTAYRHTQVDVNPCAHRARAHLLDANYPRHSRCDGCNFLCGP